LRRSCRFSPADMARVPTLLRRGLLAGLIGHNDKQGDPTLVGTVDDNGWIYEGRITVPSQAVYHAYPLLPADAFAKNVLDRFAEWVYRQQDSSLITSLQNAMDRYP